MSECVCVCVCASAYVCVGERVSMRWRKEALTFIHNKIDLCTFITEHTCELHQLPCENERLPHGKELISLL